MTGALILRFLARYWLHITVAALLAFCAWRVCAWIYGNGVRDERALWLAKENAALTQAIADNAKANDERRAAQKEVDRLATLPPKVIERVRTNPSGCVRPAPVADAARVQVDSVNEAIRKAAVR